MRCEISLFRMLFHGVLQNYSWVASRKRWQLLSNATKISIFMLNSYFPQLIRESNQIEKKILCKRNELLLVWTEKIFILSFMTLGMDLVIMSDITGMLWCLIILSFMSLSMDLIMIHDKKGVMSCCKVVSKRVLRKKVVILKTVQQIWYYRGLSDGYNMSIKFDNNF